MQNEKKEIVDLYIPRKCSWTNRLIQAKDPASVQFSVGDIDPTTGLFTGDAQTIAIAGYVRHHVSPRTEGTSLICCNQTR